MTGHDLLAEHSLSVTAAQLLLGLLFGLFIAVVSYYARLLSASGAVATFILGSLLYGLGGWKWTVPILTFFILSSLLSKAGKQRKESLKDVLEKTSVRDYTQVAANGGVAGILIVLSYVVRDFDFYPLYLGAVAAVTADTWATEVGLLSNARPLSVTTFKPVDRGMSGGVTVVGLGGSILGAVAIAASAWTWVGDGKAVVGIMLAGFVGGLVDSFLGATLQAQYRCEQCQMTTEHRIHHNASATLVSGYRWVNNEVVNWCCAISGALAMWFIV